MSRRTEKVARAIQVQLAELVNHHLNDPRIDRMITVSAVEVSPDLAHARVLITSLNASEAEMRTLLRALAHAAGRLRSLLAGRVEMRVVPQLDFRADEQAIRTRQTLAAIARAMQQTPPAPTEPPPSQESIER